MMVVGLTGGIGSGKTTVAKMFRKLGVPVYIADIEAKKLMNSSKSIREKVINAFGEEAYSKEGLNRSYMSSKVFKDKKQLEILNGIVHPEVKRDFEAWAAKQKSPYVIKEAAILFENGGYKHCDFTILVTAPLQERFKRILERDATTKKEIQQRMDNQWGDKEKLALADFLIDNIHLRDTAQKVLEIHDRIISIVSKSL